MCQASACSSGVFRSIVTTSILLFCWHDSLVQANAPPIFYDLPITVYVGERESLTAGSERLLHLISANDPNGESFTCDSTIEVILGGGTPAALPEFRVSYNSRANRHELWTTNEADFNLATKNISRFRVQVVCRDYDNTSSIMNYVDVWVVPGESLTIDNAEKDQDINAAVVTTGLPIRTIRATSFKGHDVVFNMTVSPSAAPESEFFVIDPSTGEITANRDLKFIDAGTPSVFLTINAYDEVDFLHVQETLTVHLSQQNHISLLEGLEIPKTGTFLETFPAETELFSLTLSDPDENQNPVIKPVYDPPEGSTIFYVDTSNRFKIRDEQVMNHEGIGVYKIDFYVDDGCHVGGPFTYTLTVADANEPPYFDDPMLFATIYEGAKKSTTFVPGLDCKDDDEDDTFIYTLCNPANDSNRFVMINSPTSDKGKMTYDVNYDIDKGLMPAEVILTVCCVDSGGEDNKPLTGTTKVAITILDVNDNKPVCDKTSYTFYFTELTAKGSIGTIGVTDPDEGDASIFKCSGTSSEDSANVFSIGQDCNVYLENDITFDYGKHTTYTIYPIDNGTPVQTGTCVVDIVYTQSTTTTTAATAATSSTTTDDDDSFFSSAGNIAMLSMLLLMGLTLLGLLGWCLARLCCGCGTGGQGMCNCVNRGARYPPRQVLPNSPPPQYVEKQRYRVVTVAKTGFRGKTGVAGTPGLPGTFKQGTIPGSTLANNNARSFY